MPDERIVYGTRCTWWDSIDKVGKFEPKGRGVSIPVCPFCKGTLFEVANMADWTALIEKHEANGHEGYKAFAEWCRGKCFPGFESARQAYRAATGKDFVL